MGVIMSEKQRVVVYFDKEFVKKIDEMRGLIPRSHFVEKLLKDLLNDESN